MYGSTVLLPSNTWQAVSRSATDRLVAEYGVYIPLLGAVPSLASRDDPQFEFWPRTKDENGITRPSW